MTSPDSPLVPFELRVVEAWWLPFYIQGVDRRRRLSLMRAAILQSIPRPRLLTAEEYLRERREKEARS